MVNRLLFLLIFSILLTSANIYSKNIHTVNAILGDASFIKAFQRTPTYLDSEDLRITTHLRFVLEKLHHADVSHLTHTQLENRLVLLSHLKDYIEEGVFPVNEYSTQTRRPNFIDSNGNICAVGYLVEQTAGRETAELLNALFQFDYIMNMNSEVLENWLQQNGLSNIEAAMIQPQYESHFQPSTFEVTSNNIGWDYGVLSAGLMTSQTILSRLAHSSKYDYSRKRRFWYSVTATTLGVVSIYSGVEGFKSSDRTYRGTPNPEITNHSFSYFNEKNPLKKSLSIVNVSAGAFSILYNGLHAFKYNAEMKSSNLQVYSSFQINPIVQEPIPTLSLNYSF